MPVKVKSSVGISPTFAVQRNGSTTASHLVQDAVDVVVDGDRRKAVTDWRVSVGDRWYSTKVRKPQALSALP